MTILQTGGKLETTKNIYAADELLDKLKLHEQLSQIIIILKLFSPFLSVI